MIRITERAYQARGPNGMPVRVPEHSFIFTDDMPTAEFYRAHINEMERSGQARKDVGVAIIRIDNSRPER